MLLVVTGVGSLIHVYSIGYMHDDPGYARFFAYLNLFVFSMTMLVLAGNFLVLYVFWEAVGLCSYLLIGFWYTRPVGGARGQEGLHRQPRGRLRLRPRHHVALDGARHARLRRGLRGGRRRCRRDGHRHRAPPLRGRVRQVGAAPAAHVAARRDGGADAGLGAHPRRHHGDRRACTWSRAATCSSSARRRRSRWSRGSAWLTALFAATIGLVQTDIKRVLAYSTISQLGYMFAAVGLGAYAAGIFHLVTHAFFKALLFLGAGSVIHGLSGEQDLRKMGGLSSRMVRTTITIHDRRARPRRPARPVAGSSRRTRSSPRRSTSGHRCIWALLLLGRVPDRVLHGRGCFFLAFYGRPADDHRRSPITSTSRRR